MKFSIADMIMSCAVWCLDYGVSQRPSARLAYRIGYGFEGFSLFLNGNWAALAERQHQHLDQQEAVAL